MNAAARRPRAADQIIDRNPQPVHALAGAGAGAGLVQMQQAGRWQSPAMPPRYAAGRARRSRCRRSAPLRSVGPGHRPRGQSSARGRARIEAPGSPRTLDSGPGRYPR